MERKEHIRMDAPGFSTTISRLSKPFVKFFALYIFKQENWI